MTDQPEEPTEYSNDLLFEKLRLELMEIYDARGAEIWIKDMLTTARQRVDQLASGAYS